MVALKLESNELDGNWFIDDWLQMVDGWAQWKDPPIVTDNGSLTDPYISIYLYKYTYTCFFFFDSVIFIFYYYSGNAVVGVIDSIHRSHSDWHGDGCWGSSRFLRFFGVPRLFPTFNYQWFGIRLHAHVSTNRLKFLVLTLCGGFLLFIRVAWTCHWH